MANAHSEIGQLISTLQELAIEYPTNDGDTLCCNYNELMFPDKFKDAVGTSRRSTLVQSVLDLLAIRFDGGKNNATIYFPRDLATRCAGANVENPKLGQTRDCRQLSSD